MAAGKRGNWSTEELERLAVLYPRCAEDRVAELLRRSVASVRRRAVALFGGHRRRGPWTGDDDARLRLAYGVHDLDTIALITGRTEREIGERVRRLRADLRRDEWTPTDLARLKQLYGSRTNRDLEVCLSRPEAAIERKARQLCLSKDKRFLAARDEKPADGRSRMPRWSDADIETLVQLYPRLDNLELARRLGRSVTSVANKASQLRLKKSPELLEEMGRRNVAVRYRRRNR